MIGCKAILASPSLPPSIMWDVMSSKVKSRKFLNFSKYR